VQNSTRILAAVCLGLLVLQGCSANFHSAFRLKNLDPDKKTLIAVDAKQRAIVSNGAMTCSEPSPDMFSVIAQSLSAGGSFSKSADPASMQAALNVAFGSAEQGSTIPRTQTINMLRELMFRTCERALNGSMGPAEMSIQAVRDQRLMVSILAIEQLTGAVAPKPVTIGASGSAAAGAGAGEVIIRIDDARREVEASTAEAVKAQKHYDALNTQEGETGTCDTIAKALKEGKELTEAQASQEKACTAAGAALADARAREVRARNNEADLRRLANNLGGTVATAVSANAPGGMDQARNASLTNVSEAVREIVKGTFSDGTEVMLFCLRGLAVVSENNGLTPVQADGVREMCARYLTAFIGAETEKENAERADSLRRMGTVSNDLFKRYWPTLKTVLADGTSKSQFVTGLQSQLLGAERNLAICFAAAGNEDQARACFTALPSGLQRKLAAGE